MSDAESPVPQETNNVNPSSGNLSLRNVSRVNLQIRNLTVYPDPKPSVWTKITERVNHSLRPHLLRPNAAVEPLLEDVSTDIPAGSLTAIIGGSGSGKTTLLNSISHRLSSKKLKVTGKILFNGHENSRSVRSSYVMQQDVLLPVLTVRETLQYAADLRLLPPSTENERKDAVNAVILELGLKECAETRVGNKVRRGCSGGEKRRTSIGVQMIANPSLLFCDEPTTGLDASSALQTVQTLKNLANTGRTVIISIHAPRSEIWRLFDRVILLSRGVVLYSGPADAATAHFQTCGYDLPLFQNPAEFLIDLAAFDNRTKTAEHISHTRFKQLKEAWRHEMDSGKIATTDLQPSTLGAPTLENKSRREQVGFRRQLSVLTKRNTKIAMRDPMGIAASIFEAIIMSIITGWIFLHLGNDLAGIRSRQGALYTAASLQGYLILMFEIYRLSIDIGVFDMERSEGVINVLPFLLSRRLSRIFLEDLPVPVIFTLIFYFMAGFRADVVTFFIFLGVMIISQYITVTLASLCIAVSREFASASLLANLTYTLQTFCCGYFVQSQQIPVYVRWLKWTAYGFYLFGSLAANEFIGVDGGFWGQFYACPISNDRTDPACREYVGRNIMDSLGLPSSWLWKPIFAASLFIILFFLGAGIVFRFWSFDIDVAGSLKGDKDVVHMQEGGSSPSFHEVRQVTIGLDKYEVKVQRRHLWKHTYSKTILNPVSATFEPGKINVVMGPSGSGKTTLLQCFAQRSNNNFFSTYLPFGNVTFNGAIPTASVIKSVTSYVTQDDDALMPTLTVREILQFGAGLRLPSWMSKEEKLLRAEEIILKMGLKDCANNFIGHNLKKGISGGEKRRVSIALQLLTDPKVLLLDEPTSGLDVFTATSVLDVLKTLAKEGRTIIMSIHQSRSNLFNIFDNVLLLAQGGTVVYSGEGQKMLPHFQNLGHQCPPTTNPTDFVLDLITVDLQQEDRELISREKVQRIIREWEEIRIDPARTVLASPAELSSFKREKSPFHITFPLVLKRSAISMKRNPQILTARIMQVVGLTIIFVVFFGSLKNNAEAVQSRMGFVQEIAALYFAGMLQNVAVYPTERDIFYRENLDGCYDAFVFLLSYTVLELPFTALSSLIFGVLAASALNLKRTIGFSLIASLNCFCLVTCGESLGIIFCTVFSHMGFAFNIACTFLTISTTMGGVMSLDIPAFLQAFNHLSPLKYQVANMAIYSLQGQRFTCTPAQEIDGQCPISTGEQVLKLYSLDKDAGLNLMALGITTLVYRLLAYGVLMFARRYFR